jgi:beta-barrel assembly-enhancing protease
MQRRQALGWGCAQCAGLGGWFSTAANAQTDWTAPARFTRPDVSSDEGGLWALMDREETRLRRSPFRMREENLNHYLTQVVCKLGAEHCPDIRVHPVRTPYFNANMAPNGMMQVWSGLLLRVENEAQLAAVLGHEIGHYLQRHTLDRMRDIKSRAAGAAFMGMFGVVGLIGQLATIAGAMAFSRDQEREADRIGIQLMKGAGYDPREAGKVWGNLLDELRATPGNDPSRNSVLFASHPPSDERRETLDILSLGSSGNTFEAEFQAQIAPLRFELLADDLKRGRLAESIALLNRLLQREPSSAELLYFRSEARRQRGEAADVPLAVADLHGAIAAGKEPAQVYRSLGYLHLANQQKELTRQTWATYLERAPNAPDFKLIQQQLQELTP